MQPTPKILALFLTALTMWLVTTSAPTLSLIPLLVVLYLVAVAPPQIIEVQPAKIKRTSKPKRAQDKPSKPSFLDGVRAALAAETEIGKKLFYRASFGKTEGHFLCIRLEQGWHPMYLIDNDKVVPFDDGRDEQPQTQNRNQPEPEHLSA